MKQKRYGRYETLRLIASGGMASVYLGRALGAGGFERLVAIKVMHPHIAHERDFVSMFLDEARLAARIRHPNVVPTLDVASDGTFIVMEYVEGASLFAISRMLREEEGALLPLPVALRIFIDGLEGLGAAHELKGADGELLNIVHRDVSPQNIIVGVDGISRITDFGVAHARSRITSTRGGQLKGKLPYMAPEQLRSEPVDRRTDVYAAGVVLWELLTGAPLFVGDSDAAIACSILDGPPRSPRELNGAVPAAVDEVCMRAILTRDERISSAAEFVEALEDAVGESGIKIAKRRAVGDFARQTVELFPPTSLPASSTASSRGDSAPFTADGDWRQATPAPGSGPSPQDEYTVSAPQPPGIGAPALGENSAVEAAEDVVAAQPAPAVVATVAEGGQADEQQPIWDEETVDTTADSGSFPAAAPVGLYTEPSAVHSPDTDPSAAAQQVGLFTEPSAVGPSAADPGSAQLPPTEVAPSLPLRTPAAEPAFPAAELATDSVSTAAQLTAPAERRRGRFGIFAAILGTCVVTGLIIFLAARAWIGSVESGPGASSAKTDEASGTSGVQTGQLATTAIPGSAVASSTDTTGTATFSDGSTASESTSPSTPPTASSVSKRAPPRRTGVGTGIRTGGGTTSLPRTVPGPPTEYHPPIP